MTNSSKIKCDGRWSVRPVICSKVNAHKLIYSEFHAVSCLTKIEPQVVEVISVKFSAVRNDCKKSFESSYDCVPTRSWTVGSRSECHHCGYGNGGFQKCHLGIKKAAKGWFLCKSMPMVVEGLSHLRRVDMYP